MTRKYPDCHPSPVSWHAQRPPHGRLCSNRLPTTKLAQSARSARCTHCPIWSLQKARLEENCYSTTCFGKEVNDTRRDFRRRASHTARARSSRKKQERGRSLKLAFA